MHDYPMLHFIMQWGKLIAACLAAVVVAFGIGLAAGSGNLLWAVAAIAIAAVGYGLLMSYVELIRLITDMLLPKP